MTYSIRTFFFFFLLFSALFVHAQDINLTDEEKTALALIKKRSLYLKDYRENSEGVPMTIYTHPGMVLKVVEDLEIALRPLPEKSLVFKSETLGLFYLEALRILTLGRGEFVENGKSDKKSWYLGKPKGPTGMEEILKVIERAPFDMDSKKWYVRDLLYKMKNSKFVPNGKVPELDIYYPIKSINKIMQAASASMARTTKYKTLVTNETELPDVTSKRTFYLATDKEMVLAVGGNIETKKATNDIKRATPVTFLEFAKGNDQMFKEYLMLDVQRHISDKSIMRLNANKKFPEYFVREKDVTRVLDVLKRVERSHLVLTGKSGVGKSTFMEMLSDILIRGDYVLGNEDAPVIIELSSEDLKSSVMEPGKLAAKLKLLKNLSKTSKKRFIVFIEQAQLADEITKASLLTFLSQKNSISEGRVNLILTTTLADSRKFFSSDQLASRFEEYNLVEFTKEESIEALKKLYIPIWRKEHKSNDYGFYDIDEDAYDFLYKHGSIANPHTVKSNAMKDLAEATIVQQLRVQKLEGKKENIILNKEDVRAYIKSKFDYDLIPGDEQFDKAFQARWEQFEKRYIGNKEFKYALKNAIYSHFSKTERSKMTTQIWFGPPGGGKTYGNKTLAKAFFNGAHLEISGAELKNPEFGMAKLIGSGTGYIGSEEQRSILSKFVKENPSGGVIAVEEGDFMHKDIVNFFTNMITSKTFKDGLGKDWDVSNFIFIVNTNIGQDHMISNDPSQVMSWAQQEIRKGQLTKEVMISGEVFNMVREEKLNKMMDEFIHKIYASSDGGGANPEDAAQDGQKQIRRYEKFYVMGPTREELKDAAIAKVAWFKADLEADYDIKLEVSNEHVIQLIDLENYQFNKGFGYLDSKLEKILFDNVNRHLSKKGAVIKATYESIKKANPNDNQNILKLNVNGDDFNYDLGNLLPESENQWANSEFIKNNIKHFTQNASKSLKGSGKEIEIIKDAFKRKLSDWNTRLVFSLVGTSGNGKTQTGYTISNALFEDSTAVFKLENLTSVSKLSDYFRSSTGYIGSKEETPFEKWFKSRMRSGGGVIILDELLSFHGLSPQAIQDKIAVISELFPLLDEGRVKIGNTTYDARGFILVITGNVMQENFWGIPNNPDGERIAKETLEELTYDDIVKTLKEYGMDEAKIIRLGEFFIKRPLSKKESYQVGQVMLESALSEIEKATGSALKLEVQPEVITKIVDMVSTVQLGVRHVNAKGFTKIIRNPLGGILADIQKIEEIKLVMDKAEKLHWYVNNKEVVLSAEDLGDEVWESNWVYLTEHKEGSKYKIITPQFDLLLGTKEELSDLERSIVNTHEVTGHWMTRFLLDGKNTASSINMIPGDKFLGYVRYNHKKKTFSHLTILTESLKNMIGLEAGHRSVFKKGVYAYGGGGSGIDDKEIIKRNDDMAKVQRELSSLLSNQIFEDFTEFDDERQKEIFRSTMRDLMKQASDYVIDYGEKEGIAKVVEEALNKSNFLNEEQINELVKQIQNEKKLIDPSNMLFEALKFAAEKVSVDLVETQDSDIAKKFSLIKKVLEKTKIELESVYKVKLNAGDIFEKLTAVKAKESLPNTGCDHHLKP